MESNSFKEDNIIKSVFNDGENSLDEINDSLIPDSISINQNNKKIYDIRKKTQDILSASITDHQESSGSLLKELVSQDKNRFKFDGFNLDLSYITPQIIALGFPSTSIESLYRNSISDVIQFFNYRHKNHYKVYNLCEERKYPGQIFYKHGYFPFKDHEAPPLNIIRPFCEDCKKFLDENNKNVVAIHCLAGKGRTGTLISCLLLYLGIFDTAAECLKYYGLMRVENGRGVTVPSQIRYVFYFEEILKKKMSHPIKFKSLTIKKIRVVTVPDTAILGSGCCPTFTVENGEKNKFKYDDFYECNSFDVNEPYMDFAISNNGMKVSGDVKITFYHIKVKLLNSKDKLFKLWFNTNFVPDDGVLIIKKEMIDKACKDKNCKTYKKNFRIEIHCIYN